MNLQATYISATEFKVAGDREDNFSPGRRVKANCGTADGVKYLTISSSFVNGDGDTQVSVLEAELTENLTEVLFGVVGVGSRGGLPVHDHSSNDQGGPVAAPEPEVFSGATIGEAGTKGTVPAPAAGDEKKVLQGDATWARPVRASDIRRYALLYSI